MIIDMVKSRVKCSVFALLTLLLTACTIQIPADPEGTFSRVNNGVLRVGVTLNPPWVENVDSVGGPTGVEPELVSQFGAQLNSRVEWTSGSEATLMSALDGGDLDIVIGGFLDDTPWVDQAAATRPYREITTPEGKENHVMFVRMGENHFLVALETFFHEQAAS